MIYRKGSLVPFGLYHHKPNSHASWVTIYQKLLIFLKQDFNFFFPCIPSMPNESFIKNSLSCHQCMLFWPWSQTIEHFIYCSKIKISNFAFKINYLCCPCIFAHNWSNHNSQSNILCLAKGTRTTLFSVFLALSILKETLTQEEQAESIL